MEYPCSDIGKLIRAVKQSASLINYVNEKDTELHSAIYLLCIPHVLRIIKYMYLKLLIDNFIFIHSIISKIN